MNECKLHQCDKKKSNWTSYLTPMWPNSYRDHSEIWSYHHQSARLQNEMQVKRINALGVIKSFFFVNVGTVCLSVGPSGSRWSWRSSGLRGYVGDPVDGMKELRDQAKSLCFLQQLTGGGQVGRWAGRQTDRCVNALKQQEFKSNIFHELP